MSYPIFLASLASLAHAVETVTIPDDHEVPVVCMADRIQYEWTKKFLHAQGGVTLRYGAITLKADDLTWSVDSGDVQGEGQVTLWEASNQAMSQSVRYNLKKRTAHLTAVKALSFPWTLYGQALKKPTEKDAYFVDGYLTTCETPESPHYKLAAGEIHIVMDEMIEASNVLFYAGPVPILWIPYFARSLKDGRSPFDIRPGYSSTEGFFVKLLYHVYGANAWTVDLDADYLSALGYGVGGQAVYAPSDGTRSRLFTYLVNDPGKGKQRWQFNLEHNQYLTPDLWLVGRADYLSDETFRSDLVPISYVARYMRSYGALTYRLPYGTVTGSMQDDYQWSDPEQRYKRTFAEAPRLSFQTFSFPLGEGFYAGMGAETVRSVLLPNALHSGELFGWRTRWNPFASHTARVLDTMTVNSSVNWASGWEELKADTGAPQGSNGWTHGYSSSVGTHNEWFSLLTTDVTYGYGQQLAPLAPKGGVTSNRLGVAASAGRYDRINFRLSTGYNFLPSPSELSSELQRYDPVGAELRMQSGNVEYRYTTQYDVFRSAFTIVDQAVRGLTATGIEGQAGVNFVRDGLSNPINLDLYGSLVLPLHPGLRLETGGRYELLNNYVKEQRYAVLWKFLDCWSFRASYVVRTSLVGTGLVDNVFFWFDIRLAAFPAEGLAPPIPGMLF